MSHESNHLYEFGPFRLDVSERLLLRAGETVAVTPKAFDLLLVLVERHGHLLEKDELLKLVWPDTFVEEANLSYNISLIRKALGEGEDGQRYIETVPKRGYRFVAGVREIKGERAEFVVARLPNSPGLVGLEGRAAGQIAAAQATPESESPISRGEKVTFNSPAPQSAQELTLAPASSAASGPSAEAQAPAPVQSRPLFWLLAGVGLLAVVALVAFLIGRRAGSAVGGEVAYTPPSFQRLTFRLGRVWSARFAPDGRTVIYGATWEGDRHQLYQTRPESAESRPLGQFDADILAISSLGELALALKPSHFGGQIRGTLARMPLAGTAPRPLLPDVLEADWAPDGARLAVVRVVGERRRIEFPLGTSLYESGHITSLRISPKGELLAFIEDKTLAVIDLTGRKKVLSSGWRVIDNLAWSPVGDEVWFTASEVGFKSDLYAVTLAGRQRVLLRAPDNLILEDVSRDGRVLLRRVNFRKGIRVLAPGEKQERDLSWLDWGHATDLSDDGKLLLFDEAGEGGGFTEPGGGGGATVYLRKTDGSPAVRLGEGANPALSPDGEWVAAIRRIRPFFRVVLLPTGVGEARTLVEDQIRCHYADWFPDGKRILIVGTEPGRGTRNYVQDLAGGKPRPLTPEGIAGKWVSPDGRWVIVGPISPEGEWLRTGLPERQLFLFPAAGGETRPIPGLSSLQKVL
jgi:eukaryotic-like serine/threonine-protein kinase